MNDQNQNVDNLSIEPTISNDAPSQPPVSPEAYELEVAPGKRERFTQQQLIDFYKGHLRQEDYTRKTQELAEQRKQLEEVQPRIAQLYQEHQAMLQLLEDKEKLEKYRQERFKETPPPSPDFDPAKWQQQEQQVQALHKQIQYLQQQLTQQPQTLIQQTRQEIETAQLSQHVDAHIASIFEQQKLLSVIDNAEDILRFKVFQKNPQTLDEAKKFFTEAAQEMVDKISGHFKATNTKPITSKPKGSIEPPGGAGSPAPNPTSYKGKDGKVDWSKVDQMAEAFLESYKQ
jgi:hypothetical protein